MDFLDQVPTVWDETRVPLGDPGEYIAVARKKGDAWYLGAMTDWTPRDLDIPLSFLGSGSYQARVYEDGPNAAQNATDLTIRNGAYRAADHLTVHLTQGGGVAATFTPASASP
ncbi:MAG TPA: glycoside hydrolase family 97 C-terminal domain-containing protein [Terriglobia bacterium]|nr:glycoside hydrolase family 97 C-terminal domain-containing protein [Terriglobia bacterium]